MAKGNEKSATKQKTESYVPHNNTSKAMTKFSICFLLNQLMLFAMAEITIGIFGYKNIMKIILVVIGKRISVTHTKKNGKSVKLCFIFVP